MTPGKRVVFILVAVSLCIVLVGCETVRSVIGIPSNEPATLELSHERVKLAPGERLRLRAAVRNEVGRVVRAEVQWESSDQSAGVVDTAGWVSGLRDHGGFRVIATVGELVATAQVELVPSGQCREPAAGESVTPELFGVQVLQSVEAWPEVVPLITGRPVTVRASLLSGADSPLRLPAQVTVHAARNGVAIGSVLAEGPDCLPASPHYKEWDSTFNALVPAAWLADELELWVSAAVEAGGAEPVELTYPPGEPLEFDVEKPPEFHVVFVPLALSRHGVTAQVTEDGLPEALRATASVFPLHEGSATLRAPLAYDVGDDFTMVLSVLYDAWLLDGATAHYHAFVPSVLEDPVAGGMATVEGEVSWSLVLQPIEGGSEYSRIGEWTIAHELGHNFGLRHSKCGIESDYDHTFPYYDARTNTYGVNPLQVPQHEYLVQPEVADLMSYCHPKWISDHNYVETLKFRARAARAGASPDANQASSQEGDATSVMLVSGHVSGGVAQLRPSFTFEGRPRPPEPGTWRWQLVGANGRVLSEVPFEPVEVASQGDEPEFLFGFTVPVSAEDPGAARSARVIDPTGAVVGETTDVQSLSTASVDPEPRLVRDDAGYVVLDWNGSRYPSVLVRDAGSGQLLARGEGGSLRFVSTLDEFKVLFSSGLNSVSVPVRVGYP